MKPKFKIGDEVRCTTTEGKKEFASEFVQMKFTSKQLIE